MHNIEKSAFKRGEYVGYGGGKVWRIRKTLFGGWKWAAHVTDGDYDTVYADRLSDMSTKLDKMPAAIKPMTKADIKPGQCVSQINNPEYGKWTIMRHYHETTWEVRGRSGEIAVSEGELLRFWRVDSR